MRICEVLMFYSEDTYTVKERPRGGRPLQEMELWMYRTFSLCSCRKYDDSYLDAGVMYEKRIVGSEGFEKRIRTDA